MLYERICDGADLEFRFSQCGYKNHFSYSAYELLFEYYEDLGEYIELDVEEIIDEWTEYDLEEDEILDNYEELLRDYEFDIKTERDDMIEILLSLLEENGNTILRNENIVLKHTNY